MKPSRLNTFILLSLLIFVLVVVWMSTMRKELVIPGKTNALYSLEMAWSQQRVTEIINSWDSAGKTKIAWKLNSIDFLMLLGYCPFFFFGIRRLAQLFPDIYGKAIPLLSILAILPGILDIIEGGATFAWLSGAVDPVSPRIITIVAVTKFLIGIPMTILVIGGFLAALVRRVFNRTPK